MKKICLFFMGFIFSVSLFCQNTTIIADHEDLFYLYFKGTETELTDEIITNFIRDYSSDEYKNHHQNDFEWFDILNKYRTQLSSKIAEAKLPSEYLVTLRMELGDYNFEKEGFNVKIDDGSYIPLKAKHMSYPYSRNISLFFSDFSKYNFFAIGRNEANTFLKSKTTNGRIDRRISLRIYFVVNSFSSVEYTNLTKTIRKTNYPILGQISKIEIYDGSKQIGELTKI